MNHDVPAVVGLQWQVDDRVRIVDDGRAHGMRHYLPIGSIGRIVDAPEDDTLVVVVGRTDRGNRVSQYVPRASVHPVECDRGR